MFFLRINFDLLYCYDISLENFTESTCFTFFWGNRITRGVLLKKLWFFPKPGILAPRRAFFVTVMQRCCPLWSDALHVLSWDCTGVMISRISTGMITSFSKSRFYDVATNGRPYWLQKEMLVPAVHRKAYSMPYGTKWSSQGRMLYQYEL
jgi:hypothetical protein